MEEAEGQLQRELLKKLDAYTENLIGIQSNNQKKRKKAKLENQKGLQDNSSDVQSQEFPKKSKSRLKKRKKSEKNSTEKNGLPGPTESKKTRVSGEKRHLELLKSDLGIKADQTKNRNNSDRSHVKSIELMKKESLSNSNGKKVPEVVVFETRKTKVKKGPAGEGTRKQTIDNEEGDRAFDMKQARFEVQKLGIKGLEESRREEATTSFLVKLGAKPPKNKYFNYKEYQNIVKVKKEKVIEKREIDRALGYKVSSGNRGRNKPKNKNDIGVIDGQVGRYKSGIQFVKRRDLKGFDRKKKK